MGVAAFAPGRLVPYWYRDEFRPVAPSMPAKHTHDLRSAAMAFHPYLFFSGGTCRDAFSRYQEIFGGDLEVLTNADAPPDAAMPGAGPDTVMHAALTIGDSMLMGSDDPTGDGGAMTGTAVSYTAADGAEAKRLFDALAEAGTVTMPFSPTFWSEGFGMCTDRFGVPWMVGAPAPDAPTT